VVLSGGCFQNATLLTRTRQALEAAGRRVYCHGLVPPGDGGLAVGQLAVALATADFGEKG
jgi:hydrogenase maturation protein HypF